MSEFKNHPNYNCRITLDNGEQYLVYAHWIHNQGLDHWQGWHCQAGSRRLYIDKDFTVYSALCRNDHLGSAINGFELLDSTICQRKRCHSCTDDILTHKTQNPPDPAC